MEKGKNRSEIVIKAISNNTIMHLDIAYKNLHQINEDSMCLDVELDGMVVDLRRVINEIKNKNIDLQKSPDKRIHDS